MHDVTQVKAIWLEQKAVSTRQYYRSDLERFEKWLHTRGLSLLAPPSTNDLLVFLQDAFSTATTARNRLIIVARSFYRFCFDMSYVVTNPARLLRIRQHPNVLGERIPTRRMIDDVISAAGTIHKGQWTQQRDRMLCEFAFISGARLSEIAAVESQHVQSGRSNLTQVRLFGKGSKTRWVPLPATFSDTLHRWIEAHRAKFLFSTIHGEKLNPKTIYDIVKRAARIADCRHFSPHYFRHGHATQSLENGCPLHTLKATLGHSNVATTSRYLHAQPEDSSALYLSLSPIKETTFLATTTTNTRKETHEQVSK